MSRTVSYNAFLEPPVEVISIPLELIVRDPDQPRKVFDPESITSLAESIGRFGLLQPILVGPLRLDGTYMLLSGERRFRAVCELAWETIPAIIRDETAINRIYIQGAENLARKNLGPPEILSLIERLLRSGETQSAVAKGLGMSRQTIVDYVAISRDDIARASLMKGDSFRSVIDLLRGREPSAPPPGDLEGPPATITSIRPDTSAAQAPSGKGQSSIDDPDAVLPRDDTSGGDRVERSGRATLSFEDDDEQPVEPARGGAGSQEDPAAEVAAPTSAEPAPVAAGHPPLADLAQQVLDAPGPSDDPDVLRDRAERLLAAGLEIASDLPEPQFSKVVEAHYRKVLSIRDMGSARP